MTKLDRYLAIRNRKPAKRIAKRRKEIGIGIALLALSVVIIVASLSWKRAGDLDATPALLFIPLGIAALLGKIK